MEVKIKEASKLPYISNKKLRDFLTTNAGKFVKVETKHLFNNQYNTKDFRLFDSYISGVKNDARKNKGVCGYCGTQLKKPTECKKYTPEKPCFFHGKDIGNCKGFSKWFLPSNTFFLMYPKGISEQEEEFTPAKIGTYTLTKRGEGYNIRNARKNINFKFDGKYFFISDSIGYKRAIFLGVPYNVQIKLKEILTK